MCVMAHYAQFAFFPPTGLPLVAEMTGGNEGGWRKKRVVAARDVRLLLLKRHKSRGWLGYVCRVVGL